MRIPETNQNDIINEIEGRSSIDKWIGIYGLRNRVNNKWYIGQSVDIKNRWEVGYKTYHCKKQRKLYNALIKYGYENFDKIVLEICSLDENLLTEREDHWIKFYNSINNGYNIREASSKGKVSEETKLKISQSLIGRKVPTSSIIKRTETRRLNGTYKRSPLSDETKLKISNSLKGKKVSMGFTGKKHSNETKLKMSLSSKGKSKHHHKLSSIFFINPKVLTKF